MLRLTLTLVLLPAVCLMPASANAQPPTVADALRARLPEVALDEAPFDSVIEWLAAQTGLSIHVNWDRLADYDIPRDRPVSLKARNLPLAQVLWLLMNQVGGGDVRLAYRGSDTLLLLSTEEDLGREMLTRVYDVRDLLDRAPRFTNAVRLNLDSALQQGSNSGSAGLETPDTEDGDEPPAADDPAGAELVRLITDTVEPDSWVTANGRGRIVFWRGQIVVFNTIFVHQRLGGPVRDE